MHGPLYLACDQSNWRNHLGKMSRLAKNRYLGRSEMSLFPWLFLLFLVKSHFTRANLGNFPCQSNQHPRERDRDIRGDAHQRRSMIFPSGQTWEPMMRTSFPARLFAVMNAVEMPMVEMAHHAVAVCNTGMPRYPFPESYDLFDGNSTFKPGRLMRQRT